MSETKLLRCPCCSEESFLETMKVRKGWEADITCSCCGLNLHTITYYTEDEAKECAITHWNTRKPMQNIVERLEDTDGVIAIDLKNCSIGFHEHDFNTGKSAGINKAIEIVKEEGEINE